MNLRLRHYFVTGLLVWLPMGITVWVLTWLVGMLDSIFLTVRSTPSSLACMPQPNPCAMCPVWVSYL